MFSKFTFILCFVLSCYCFQDGFKVQLRRQKTPHENILATPNLPEHGVWLDWFKKENRTNDTIPLLRFLDSQFYGVVNFGKPGQKLKLIFDTAWSTSWIMSKDCPTKTIGCWFHSKYDHIHSSTYTPNNKSFIVNEGTFNLTGYYSTDVISFSHYNVSQTFVEMVGVPYWYIFQRADGVIGLGLDREDGVVPFFNNIIRQTPIKKQIFSIYLNRDKSSKNGGSIFFGGIEKKHILSINKTTKADITYVPINAMSASWEFIMDNVTISHKNKNWTICTNCIAFSDTSSNSIIVPKEHLAQINSIIGAKPLFFGKYEVDCNYINQMPHISFGINNRMFNLTGSDYVQKMSIRLISVCISAFVEATTTSEQSRWYLGGAFLSKYYSIYDLENQRIGFVRAAGA